MNLALAKNETGRAPSDSFAVARDRLPGTGRVAEARRAAFEAYEAVGLPHRRIEDWKYTDLRAAMRDVLPTPDLALAVTSTLAVMRCVAEQIAAIEHAIKARVSLRPTFRHLLTVAGIGQTLALTIMLEAGDMHRFPTVGQWASYCRCVNSTKLSNGKRKGQGNTKNGNKYLAWAFIEAANFAVRYYPDIQRFYQRKKAKTQGVVAIKAVAHKLARACYYVLRDQVPFEIDKAFTRQPA